METVMKIFCTGASGYIGGSVAVHLVAAGHEVTGLVRSQDKADAVRARGIQPLLGTLDDADVLSQAANAADVVVNAASADHKGAVVALLDALAGSGKPFIHTSGSSIIGTRARGERSDAVFDEDTPFTPSPARAARVALNEFILSYRDKGCRPVIICPSLIYGRGPGAGPHSVQVPLLISLAKKRRNAAHAGPGENIWSNVHIDDLVTLYALAIEKAPTGSFYFAENGEHSMRDLCLAINRMLGFQGPPTAMSMADAASEWSEGTTEDTMASNSRVRAKRARQLGWTPKAGSVIEEIEQGCYRE
jgi:nucleoside-diphosphate-sugar epimerase